MTKLNFKQTRFHVMNAAEADKVQKAMFALGFMWNGKQPGEERKVRDYFNKGGYIYVDEACRMFFSTYQASGEPWCDYQPMLQATLFAAAEAAKAEKRSARKASRKRKSLRAAGWIDNKGVEPGVEGKVEVRFRNGKTDADEEASDWYWGVETGADYEIEFWRPVVVVHAGVWNKNTTGKCPVAKGTKIDVEYRDGEKLYNVPALTSFRGRDTMPAFWELDGMGGDIVAYRLAEQKAQVTVTRYPLATPKAERVVSLHDMVDDIVLSAGGREVQEVDPDGFITWHGVTRSVANSSEYSGPVAKGTKVDVKFRDGKIARNLAAGDYDVDPETQRRAGGAFWANDGMINDIVAYRVRPAEAFNVAAGEAVFTGQLNAAVCAQPDTNPKRQYGVSSVPLNMWSPLASAYGALGLYNGALKYGKANFANTPVEASIYIAAAQRHLSAWASGEEFDPADGVPNLGGVLANIAILLEARAAGTLIDDRLNMAGYLKERDALKEIVKSLNALHEGKNPKHYTLEAE